MTGGATRRGALRAAAAVAATPLLPLAGCLSTAGLPGATPGVPGTPGAPGTTPAGIADEPPAAPREFRAAWVATVANIDWPSRPGLSGQAMRAEAVAMLDRARTIGLNALILQVRPAADAIYPSALEPWSEYLSGEQGRPPWGAGEPPWDPLAFWLQEAHARGLELHVWFNPYRARHSAAKSPPAPTHVAQRTPQIVRSYGDMLWMDPGEPAAAAHTLAVVADVLRRYAVDGVHIDDYFYPYPVVQRGADLPFPDDAPFARYAAGGGLLARDDWRRANVDAMVQALHRTVRETRPGTRFGVSPFGLGRPDRRPPGVTGFSQYDKLYADVERWLANGWMDYLAPQLYWPRDRAGQPFEPLLDYWLAENTAARHVFPGLFTSRIVVAAPERLLGPNAWPASEIVEQVSLTRSRPAAGGHIHFSMVALMQDRDGIATLLRQGPYAQPALPPATPWLGDRAPPAPALRGGGARVEIVPATGAAVARWAVWRQRGGRWQFDVLAPATTVLDATGAERVAVAAVDRLGNLSPYQFLGLR